MAVALDYGSSGLGSSPGCGHCVVFLGNTLYVHAGREVGGGAGGSKDGLASYLTGVGVLQSLHGDTPVPWCLISH